MSPEGTDEPQASHEDNPTELLGWAVVANVADGTRHGPGGAEVRRGLSHFSPGTKVWVLPAQWGDGWASPIVVGRHRGSSRFVQMVVPPEHLEHFRVEGAYSPAVLRELTTPWDPGRGRPGKWASREAAEEAIARHPVTRDRRKQR